MLTVEQVELAAYLGHEGAQHALEREPVDRPLGAWLAGLWRWGRVPCVRAALSIANSFTVVLRRPGESTPPLRLIEAREHTELARLEPDRPLIVGRSSQADVQLLEDRVSRLHCELTLSQDGQVRLRDLDSGNGTYVEGAPVQERALSSGQPFRVGSTILELRPERRLRRSQRAIVAVEDWLDDPGVTTAEAVVLERLQLQQGAELTPANRTALAALHAVVHDPPEFEEIHRPECGPWTRVSLLDPIDSESARAVVRGALLPWALCSGKPLPADLHPPAKFGRSSLEGFRWSRWAEDLERELGLRVTAVLERGRDPRELDHRVFLAWNPRTASREYLYLGSEHGVLDPGWITVAHESLVPVLALGTCPEEIFETWNWSYFIREAAVGRESLLEWRARTKPNPMRSARVVERLCQAVSAASELATGGTGLSFDRVAVLDDDRPVLRGLCRAQVGSWWRTEPYPERYHKNRPEGAVARSQVWELGSMFYELVTGQVAFPAEGSYKAPPGTVEAFRRIDSLRAARTAEIVAPSALVRIEAALESVILRALARDPEDRYPTPSDMAKSIRVALASIPDQTRD